MAQVTFKRGLQSKIDELLAAEVKSFEEGSFYLTTDTDRLYFAQSATELVLLNHTTSVVSAKPEYSDSLTVGDTFYCPDDDAIYVVKSLDADAGTVTWDTIGKSGSIDASNFVAGDGIAITTSEAGEITISSTVTTTTAVCEWGSF